MKGFLQRHWQQLALLGIMLVAVFFRFYRLSSLPPGLFPDEAANGLDVFRIFDGDIRPLYNTNGPRESLFFFLQAFFVLCFGNSILALRLAPALVGTLAVLATYLFVKEWLGRQAGLLAAALMASAPWAVTMSRIGFRASMLPLVVPLSIYTFTKALRTQQWRWGIASGLCFGAGFYTYISFRAFPVAIAVIAVFAAIKKRQALRVLLTSLKRPLLATMIVTALLLIPLGLYGLSHPAEVLGGRSSVSFTNPELNGGDPLGTLVDTVVKTALMFNIAGDTNFRHNLGGAPLLDPITGVLFLGGLLLALRRILDVKYFALLALFGVFLLPEIATAEGIPHALRAIGAIPFVYIFAALSLYELIKRLLHLSNSSQALQTATVAVTLVLISGITVLNYHRHFVVWANDPRTAAAYSEDIVRLSNYLKSTSFDKKPFVAVGGFDTITILYLHGNNLPFTRLEPHQIDAIALLPRQQLIVMESWVGEAEPLLLLHAPLQETKIYSATRPDTVVFRVYERAE